MLSEEKFGLGQFNSAGLVLLGDYGLIFFCDGGK